jgi:histone arginine demethylase JMJD6
MTLVSRQRLENAARALPRLARPHFGTFVQDYLAPGRPVVVEGALRDWPALGKWTPEFLAREWGDLVLPLDGARLPMRELVAQLEEPAAGLEALQTLPLDARAPGLGADLLPLPDLLRPNWLDGRFLARGSSIRDQLAQGARWELLLGKPGATLPALRFDTQHLHRFVCQLYGVNEVVAYPPDETRHLYPCEDRPHLSRIPLGAELDLDAFPDFRKAFGASTSLSPGDLLFLPAGWWYALESRTVTLAVTHRSANRSNWPSVVRNVTAQPGRPVRARLMAGYLRGVGVLRSVLRQ